MSDSGHASDAEADGILTSSQSPARNFRLNSQSELSAGYGAINNQSESRDYGDYNQSGPSYGAVVASTEKVDIDDREDIIRVSEELPQAAQITTPEQQSLAEAFPTSPNRTIGGTRTVVNILIAQLGPGALAFPLAFKYCGLYTGMLFTFLIAVLNIHCMKVLVSTSRRQCKRFKRDYLDYGHLVKKTLDMGPDWVRRYSKRSLYVTNILICIYQIGTCSIQLVFMGSNLNELVSHFYPNLGLRNGHYMSMILPPVILISVIRDLKALTLLSFLGSTFLIPSFLLVLVDIVQPPNQYNKLEYVTPSVEGFLMFLGVVLYGLEGQPFILSLENQVKRPWNLTRTFGVIDTAMYLGALAFIVFGFYGYVKYGEHTLGSITLNLEFTYLNIAVIVMLIVNVYVGIPMQNYVVIAMLWPGIKRKLPPIFIPYARAIEYLFLLILVLLEYTLAMAIPNLSLIIPFVGISAGMVVSMIFPPLLDIAVFWEDWTLKRSRFTRSLLVAKNIFILLFGVVVMIGGLYANILSFIRELKY